MKEKRKEPFFSSKYVAYLGALVALVIVFQALSGVLKINATTFCFVLVPIVLGGTILGVVAGAILGVVFGIVVIVDAVCGLDPFTLFLLSEQPFATVVLCIGKGVAAGVIPALAYKPISKKSEYVGVIVAAVLAPVCNTGVFAIFAFIVLDPILQYLAEAGMSVGGMSSAYVVFGVLIGVNFFVELAINIVLSPAIYSVNRVVEKQIRRKKGA